MSTTTASTNNFIDQDSVAISSNSNNSNTNRGGYYKSFLKPGKFWQRGSNKVANSNEGDQHKQQQHEHEEQDEEHHSQQVEQTINHPDDAHHHNNKKSFISMPTPFKSSTKSDRQQSPALREAAKAEVYKLSIVNDSGIFLPPSPKLDSKRDNWIEMDEEAMSFRLPSPECLTTYGNNDKTIPTFYTPSAMVFPRSSSVDTNNEDDVPSLSTDISSVHSS
ncbi:hypothetical protein INT45_008233 [Circinella minor]|uniref:Uncharacterized protein n=1 Tax=Circinella minor TaxID=1195481 RepID=A0A8H7S7B6_9FUNG|nr:hypothetical protein INT45_008233 [Circinella minor]